MKANYHTHCNYCDGKESIEVMVEAAAKLQFSQLGFSSHAPIRENDSFSISESEIPNYVNEIERCQGKFPEIKLLKGFECDYIAGLTKDFSFFKQKYNLDYIIGGIHLVKSVTDDRLWFIDGSNRGVYINGLHDIFANNIKKAVTAFWEQTFEMIETQQFDIIAHFDKIKMHNKDEFFTEDEAWYLRLVDHAVDLIKKHQLIVELNPRGIYKGRCSHLYPSDYILDKVSKYKIPVVLSSDAHHSSELVLYRDEMVKKLAVFGIRETVCFEAGVWNAVQLDYAD